MITPFSCPNLDYDLPATPAYTGPAYPAACKKFGRNCARSVLSIHPNPDLPRAKAWGADLGANPTTKIIYDYAPATARPTTAQVIADVQAARIFLEAQVAAGASWGQFILKGINEPVSTNTAQPWNPDPDLIRVHVNYYAAIEQYIPEVYANVGSPSFDGGNDGSSPQMAMWSAAREWPWLYTFINCSPDFPGVGLTLAQWGKIMNWAIEKQVNVATQCFPNAHPFILEMTPSWESFMSVYDPVKHGQIVWQAWNDVPVGGHLSKGGMGLFPLFVAQDASSQPVVLPSGQLSAMGAAAVAAETSA